MAASDGKALKWRLTYQDKDYEFDANRDLTVVKLRQCKGWFGLELGRWATFIQALSLGDPDAWCCALWIAMTNAGARQIPSPQNMDFAVGEMMDNAQEVDDGVEEAADPLDKDGSEDDQTPDSTPTSTS